MSELLPGCCGITTFIIVYIAISQFFRSSPEPELDENNIAGFVTEQEMNDVDF